MKTISEKEALHKATAYCSAAERCIADVTEKLSKWDVPGKESQQIIDYLLQENFINETRYVKSYVADKLTFNKWGKIKIAYNLQQKKIDAKLIQQELDSIDDDTYFDLLLKLLLSKRKTITGKNEYEIKNKLFKFALSRGFSSSDSQTVVNQLFK